MNRKIKYVVKNEMLRLPKSSGVYCFKDNLGKFLYIGKAANIKERVKNHFNQPVSLWEQTVLGDYRGRIGYIKTNSEIEALVLEANLIKKYRPKYNIAWRDDKNYFYVAATKEDFPRLFITHQAKPDFNFVGPFTDGKALKETVKILRKVFPYRSCKVMPKSPCLWHQLDRCPAPCLTKTNLGGQLQNFKIRTRKECQDNIGNIFKILQGRKNEILKKLKKEMRNASVLQNYERAAELRDRMRSLEKVVSHASVLESAPLLPENDWLKTLAILQKITGIRGKPAPSFKIEAYDVSNIQGEKATGSLVAFIQGKPDKNLYRKFKIKIQGKPNDTAMISEILSRRLKHEEWKYPELILIDGGKPQLNAAVKTKRKNAAAGKIRFAALAKKKNELFLEERQKPILLKSLPREISDLILRARDEAHRFAKKYHKHLVMVELK